MPEEQTKSDHQGQPRIVR